MTVKLTPVQRNDLGDVGIVQATQRLHREALPKVRGNAMAWRNGLAGLLAGLLGFSLLKGQDDITRLTTPWAVAVGLLLLGAFVVGGIGAMGLLWAAHGRPKVIKRTEVRSGLAADRAEAVAALRSLRWGIRLTVACAMLITAAVATTWYGPTTGAPELEVTLPSGPVCGSVVRVEGGVLTLATTAGERHMSLAEAVGMHAVEKCSG
ncbi:hypothetical protein [Catellatospora chokoriensis]|uniref:Uncharacterized protein n=1 Tax=Catellatospora chokoriensis TaxID=310353 RepID=A0A8J3K482_9ACTN|nr:hypothetical protein [Catellatospora chokoriensis]GIF90420.1 hypothetical protein Cch02nite_38640 [Catellatospora chokoriensis]